MHDDLIGSVPWLAGAVVGNHAIRPSVFRDSHGLFRLKGSSDPCAIAFCERFQAEGKRFIHEGPLTFQGLDIQHAKRREDCEQSGINFAQRHALISGVLEYVDAIDRVRDSQGTKLAPVEASDILEQYLGETEEDAPDSLICRIARKDAGRLLQVCAAPRVLLRRERQMVPVARAKHLDVSCMRWLDIQPGTSVVEKAGSAQRIKSVVRRRATDTLENRVLRDLLLRGIEAANQYCTKNKKYNVSQRVRLVRRFARELDSMLLLPEIASIRELSILPTPNYVLQNDLLYKYVWKTWHDLLRKRQFTQQTIRWASRWLSEIAFLGVLDALKRHEEVRQEYSHGLWLRPEPHNGEFLEAGAPVGSFRLKLRGANTLVHMVRSAQLARGFWPATWRPWAQLAPDFAVVSSTKAFKPILCWNLVLWLPEQTIVARNAVAELEQRLRGAGAVGIVFQTGGDRISESESVHTEYLSAPSQAPSAAAQAIERILARIGVGR